MRQRTGNGLYPMKSMLRDMIRDKDDLTGVVFLSDQTPRPKTAYWTTFLNQDTPFYTGVEKIARHFSRPVIYIAASRPKRGKYHVEFELLTESPEDLKPNELLELFVRRLEKDIVTQPELWLWSHRRWKHKRPT